MLGAGAVALNNLKNITAKHLGLSSQCISFLLGELPYVKLRIEISLNEKMKGWVENELSIIKRDLLNHREEIFRKLATLLCTRYFIKRLS